MNETQINEWVNLALTILLGAAVVIWVGKALWNMIKDED